MPPRKKETTEEAAEPERRSTRIREMPAKPLPAAPAAKPVKRVKKTDPELSEWKPTKKASAKKRKKADVAAEEAEDAEDEKTKDVEGEEKPKKKAKTETKATKGKKAAAGKEEAVPPAGTSAAAAATAQAAAEGGNKGKDEPSALKIGIPLPQITLKNEKGDNVDLSTLASQNGVVIFAAPKADTPGCNKQSCHFRDSTAEFTKLGYDVYGLTSDSPDALTKWKTKNSFQYTLLSDPKREFIGMLGAKSGNSTKRSHFVFEKETGKLLDAKIGVKPDTSHSAALEFIKSL